MLERYGLGFYQIGATLKHLNALVFFRVGNDNKLFDEQLRQTVCSSLEVTKGWCNQIGLKLSVVAINRLIALPPVQWTYSNIEGFIDELQRRVEDELNSVHFMHLSETQADFYKTPALFGQQVNDSFPSAAFDIEEAGKCFALNRSTGCVMHLMRVIEVGLKAYGTGLGVMALITSAQPNWNDVLRVVRDEIQRLNRSNDPVWTPEKRAFFEYLHPHFHAIRIAWRNPSMHTEQKYDPERAEEILNSVKAWMRHMAEYLDESGQFTP